MSSLDLTMSSVRSMKHNALLLLHSCAGLILARQAARRETYNVPFILKLLGSTLAHKLVYLLEKELLNLVKHYPGSLEVPVNISIGH